MASPPDTPAAAAATGHTAQGRRLTDLSTGSATPPMGRSGRAGRARPQGVRADDVQTTNTAEQLFGTESIDSPLFMGRKARRRSSAYKLFGGDALGVNQRVSVMKILMNTGDHDVCFSEQLRRVGHAHTVKQCFVVLGDTALYVFSEFPDASTLRRIIPLRSITQIRMSPLPDNFVYLNVEGGGRNLLLWTSRKTELVVKLLTNTERVTGSRLEVMFAQAFAVALHREPSVTSNVLFTHNEVGVNMEFK